MHLHGNALRAQLHEAAHGGGQGVWRADDGVGVRGAGRGGASALLEQLQHALDAHGPADGRRRFAAEFGKEAVVAPAAADGALRAEALGDEFKNGEVVVVQPAHEARVDAPRHASGVQHLLHGAQVRLRCLAQMVHEARGGFHQRLHGGVFGVQNAQRVGVEAARGVFVQLAFVRFKVGDKGGAVLAALLGLAEAAEFQMPVADAEFAPEFGSQQDEFGVRFRAGKTQGFRANLVKLPVAPALRPLAPEHRPHVVEPLRAAALQQVVFKRGAHDAGGVFRAQREAVGGAGFVGAVGEGIHLFFHHVGGFAQPARKQRRVLQNGSADVAVGKAAHGATHDALQPEPALGGGREDVVHATDGGKLVFFLGHSVVLSSGARSALQSV